MKLSLGRLFRIRALAVLPALALAVAGLTATAAPASAATSTGWNDYSCKPSASHPRPVVLVHGTFENGTDNWEVLAPYLEDRGYCVFSFDYGMITSLGLFGGLGPIADSAQQLSDEVNKVLSATGAAKVDLVGHSQGGMMPRYYLKFLGGAAKVNALVGLAPDNHGTTLDGLEKIADKIPGAEALVGDVTPGLTDQLSNSAFLQKLNAGGDTVPGVKYTVIATDTDEVVTPYQSEFLSGSNVHNVLLQDLCPVDVFEHVLIGTTDLIAFHEVSNALDPAHATPSTCLDAGDLP